MTPQRSGKVWQFSKRLGIAIAAGMLVLGGMTCAKPLPPVTNLPEGTTPATPPSTAAGEEGEPKIRFSHKAHVEEATCLACHATYEEEADAGEPTLDDCLDCHGGMQSTKPADQAEERKLNYYANLNKQIPWPSVGMLAPATYFSHKVHIVEGELSCEDCHGDIAETESLPTKPAYAYNHELCGQCHDTEEDKSGCRMCHPR